MVAILHCLWKVSRPKTFRVMFVSVGEGSDRKLAETKLERSTSP